MPQAEVRRPGLGTATVHTLSWVGLVRVLFPGPTVDGGWSLGFPSAPCLVAELVGVGFESGSPEVTAPPLSRAFPSPYLISSQLQPAPCLSHASSWISKSTGRPVGHAGPGV